jgi:hypothetical protein
VVGHAEDAAEQRGVEAPPVPPNTAISARPRAKLAVVMTPMAASEPMTRRRVTPLIISADARPHAPAPSRTLTPSRALAA